MKKTLGNWGNYPMVEADEKSYSFDDQLGTILENGDNIIARGNGRCYGDASLSDQVISTLKSDNILEFDTNNGIFDAQAGILLKDILDVVVPKGWFLPVTPGTKYISLGGALASDVHGKNHHVDGSFSDHVLSFRLMMSDQTIKEVTPDDYDLFYATAGGMGLTGVILSAKIRLKKIETSFIRQKQVKAKNLDEIMDLFESHAHYTYSMAWIDCLQSGRKLGRSIMIVGEHASTEEVASKDKLKLPGEKKLNMPFYLPGFVLNRLSIKAFNLLYYFKNYRKEMNSVVPYDGFFYPLDSILHWNRMYGKRGFVQYQFVLPLDKSREGLREILERINKKGWGSFLAVLKLFGKQNGMISFPMEGYTLALDFPVRKGLLPFLDELDELVLKYEGRIYLSKDARMNRKMMNSGYPELEKFNQLINTYNPQHKFSSVQSKRLFGL